MRPCHREFLELTGIGAYRDVELPGFPIVFQILIIELELPGRNAEGYCLGLSRCKIDFLKVFQFYNGSRNRCFGVSDIELYDFFSGIFSGIGNVDAQCYDIVISLGLFLVQNGFSIRVPVITQPVTERIEGFIDAIDIFCRRPEAGIRTSRPEVVVIYGYLPYVAGKCGCNLS